MDSFPNNCVVAYIPTLVYKDDAHLCKDLNIEQGAFGGSGRDFTLGDSITWSAQTFRWAGKVVLNPGPLSQNFVIKP